ncbi:MAG: potassium-transporting ATPase subunit KdpC [Candidatus Krumholzibacteriia bacterium]
MSRQLAIAARMTLVTLVLTGLLYPLLVTGAASLLFPRAAAGSLVAVDGRTVGSALIGQRFAGPARFQGRPSAAGPDGYDATASGGSNLGPLSAKLRDRAAAELARLVATNPDADGPPPTELLAASASGLDPHLSPAAALWQAPRVAAARGVALREVQALVTARIEPRTLGCLGEPRVNVLLLNLDLDRRFGRPAGAP